MKTYKKHFNLYYNSMRINSLPINEDELNTIISNGLPIKKQINNEFVNIPLNKIRIVKCTIV